MDGHPPPAVTPAGAAAGAAAGADVGTDAGTARWRAALYDRLRGRPLPLVWTPDGLVPAATLWTGARLWTAWLREGGLAAGDRLVCALPPGPAFVMVLVAALWEGLTLVPVPPAEAPTLDALLDVVDARLAVGPPGTRPAPGVVACDAAGTPPAQAGPARPRLGAPTPDACFLLQTSGTTGAPRRVALSAANVWAVLDSHAPHLALADRGDGAPATVLSVLPWHHAFGLVMELLPALLAGAEVVREPSGGRDPAAMLAAAAEHPVTHLFAVPLTVRRLAESERGRTFLRALRGGVVGGAPADAALAEVLGTTRLRAGYGQTEASPGVTLGAAGAWRAGALGAPLGCEVRLDDDGVLAFRGPNACLGLWRAAADGRGALDRPPPDRWVRTGDLARREADGTYTFEGRLADGFKLDNGRFVGAAALEARVRERWAHVSDALLSSPDGRGLVLAVSTADGADPPPADALAEALGPLAGRPLQVVRVAADAWARTPKGELDRRFPTGRPAAQDAPEPAMR